MLLVVVVILRVGLLKMLIRIVRVHGSGSIPYGDCRVHFESFKVGSGLEGAEEIPRVSFKQVDKQLQS